MGLFITNTRFSFHKTLSDGLLWIIVILYYLFELILTAPIHYKGSIDEQLM